MGLGIYLNAGAQISISLPDTLIGNVETDFIIDIKMTEIGDDSVSGFTFNIEYDPNKIFIEDYTKTTLSAGFFVQDNNQETGIYRITGANSTPIRDNGILIQINAAILDTGQTYLNFNNASVNEGDPEVSAINGKLMVWSDEYPPDPVSPIDTSIDTDTSVVLSWRPNPFYQLYEVHFSEDEDFFPTLVYTNVQDTVLLINDLDYNTDYFWKVRAISFSQATVFSETYTFKTIKKPNTAPTVSSPVKDITLEEDFGSLDIAFLDTVITDQETSRLSFEVTSTGNSITHYFQNRNLWIDSKPNYFGLDTLIISGTDESGLLATDTVYVQVNSVNDTPNFIQELPNSLIFDMDKRSYSFTLSEYITDVDHDLSELDLVITSNISLVDINFDQEEDLLQVSSKDTNGVELFSFYIEDEEGGRTDIVEINIQVIITELESENNSPKSFQLSQNYPNPFNPSTNINFSIPEGQHISLKVFDISGREVATIVDGVRGVGEHSIQFDASNLSSGVYIYQLRAGDRIETKRMLLLK